MGRLACSARPYSGAGAELLNLEGDPAKTPRSGGRGDHEAGERKGPARGSARAPDRDRAGQAEEARSVLTTDRARGKAPRVAVEVTLARSPSTADAEKLAE